MEFRTADTFYASLGRLTNQEQKAVKITVFDLQADPSSRGLRFHKLDHSRDPNFWSVRVNRDIRLIVHRTERSLLLVYVDHHDDAYKWAERRKIETHPRTGAAQLVEIKERVEEVVVPVEVPATLSDEPLLFADTGSDALLGYGVPEEWLSDVQNATESTLFDLAEHLPQEAADALLELATGGMPSTSADVYGGDPFQHPDAQRRFRVMDNIDELQRALDYPWERWSVFLHPVQRRYVERDYNGPARVAGTAGTGKTVVALHRAVRMAEAHPQARVLLTTFSESLVANLETKLDRLVSDPAVRGRIDVDTLASAANKAHEERVGPVNIASRADVAGYLTQVMSNLEVPQGPEFVEAEWQEIVDAWNVRSWDEYRTVQRLGRKTRLGEKQRRVLWDVFEAVRSALRKAGQQTQAMVLHQIADMPDDASRPYNHIVVDEAQDISVPELAALSGLSGDRPDAFFFAGDLGQRIFQTPFSWKSLGVDVRGRSHTLKINYRTSHQIRRHSDRLLPPSFSDVDGVAEDRCGVISVFEGKAPKVAVADDRDEEARIVADWIAGYRRSGIEPSEIAVFVRSGSQIARAMEAVKAAGEVPTVLGNEQQIGKAMSVGTMHSAKGLEVRAVVVMACDDDVLPDQERIEALVDEADLEEVYNTERHLLYVACTRARDELIVTGVDPASEFLDDLELA